MMTHPDYVLQATRDRQERIKGDMYALKAHQTAIEPGKVRRTLGSALINLGERVGGRQETRETGWSAARQSPVHLI